MAAVAHNPQFAAKVGVPVSVGEEFNAADEALANPNKKKPKPEDVSGYEVYRKSTAAEDWRQF